MPLHFTSAKIAHRRSFPPSEWCPSDLDPLPRPLAIVRRTPRSRGSTDGAESRPAWTDREHRATTEGPGLRSPGSQRPNGGICRAVLACPVHVFASFVPSTFCFKWSSSNDSFKGAHKMLLLHDHIHIWSLTYMIICIYDHWAYVSICLYDHNLIWSHAYMRIGLYDPLLICSSAYMSICIYDHTPIFICLYVLKS